MTTTVEGPVFCAVKMDIHEGKLEEFKELGKEIMKEVQENDPGCMQYDWFLSPDGRNCHIMEKYASNEALLSHMTSVLGPYSERLFAISAITDVYFYTPVSDAVKEAAAALNPLFFEAFNTK
jgi:quinol monooxygenase YgiN